MDERHSCPLCTETYDNQTDLHVHLEVNHRKSEIVTYLVELHDEIAETPVDSGQPLTEEERPAPSAD